MAEETPRLGIKKYDGTDNVKRLDFNNNYDIIDSNVVKDSGVKELISDTLTNRPTAGEQNRYFLATDTGEIFRDTGTEWKLAAASDDEFKTHKAEEMPHETTDTVTNQKYKYGLAVKDGVWGIEKLEVSE